MKKHIHRVVTILIGIVIGLAFTNFVFLQSEIDSIKYQDNSKYFQNSQIKIQIYTTEWCPVCQKAKEYLSANGFRFEEKDIEENDDWQNEFEELSDGSIPLLVLPNLHVVGFTESLYDKSLDTVKAY